MLDTFLYKERVGYRSYQRTEDTFKSKNSIKAVRKRKEFLMFNKIQICSQSLF